MQVLDFVKKLGDWVDWLTRKPSVAKKENALRFGILGAANIAPQALIVPARSHAEVIVVAVAARDRKKAEAFAKWHEIPIVHDNYDALINDPSIDCIYNPLPNGLHYEWTLKALQAGKHVLLEKPSVSNASEAKSLFRHPVLSTANAPVLLEASHYRFHPAWHTLLSLFNPSDVVDATVRSSVPVGLFPAADIRFQYELAGGTFMDLGHYTLSALRGIFAAEPSSITSATPRLMPPGLDTRCDEAMHATYTFPNGGTGTMFADLRSRGGWPFPWLTRNWPCFWRDIPPWVRIVLRQEQVGERDGRYGVAQTVLEMRNFMAPHVWHRIDMTVTETWRNMEDPVVETKVSKDSRKAYVWPEGKGGAAKGDESWSTYRYQLEEFVNRVKGRAGSGAWVDAEESIRHMEVVDQTYQKAGMAVRPSCKALRKDGGE